jgi:prepilin-type N-terminal cleavage/methylation domain-containing protein
MKKTRGFTLIELLIVVAIILVVICGIVMIVSAARDPKTFIGGIVHPQAPSPGETLYAVDWIEPGHTVMVSLKDGVDVTKHNTDAVLRAGLTEVGKEWHLVMPASLSSRYNGTRAEVTTAFTFNVRPKD